MVEQQFMQSLEKVLDSPVDMLLVLKS